MRGNGHRLHCLADSSRSLDANGVVAELAGPRGGGDLLAGLHRARLPAPPLAHEVQDQQTARRPYCSGGKMIFTLSYTSFVIELQTKSVTVSL